MNGKPPDVCRFVFVCAFEDWQVQAAPRARSDLGGALDTFRELADAHRVHVFEDHTHAEREEMRRRLERLHAPAEITRRREGHSAGMLVGLPLPLWWVDK